MITDIIGMSKSKMPEEIPEEDDILVETRIDQDFESSIPMDSVIAGTMSNAIKTGSSIPYGTGSNIMTGTNILYGTNIQTDDNIMSGTQNIMSGTAGTSFITKGEVRERNKDYGK